MDHSYGFAGGPNHLNPTAPPVYYGTPDMNCYQPSGSGFNFPNDPFPNRFPPLPNGPYGGPHASIRMGGGGSSVPFGMNTASHHNSWTSGYSFGAPPFSSAAPSNNQQQQQAHSITVTLPSPIIPPPPPPPNLPILDSPPPPPVLAASSTASLAPSKTLSSSSTLLQREEKQVDRTNDKEKEREREKEKKEKDRERDRQREREREKDKEREREREKEKERNRTRDTRERDKENRSKPSTWSSSSDTRRRENGRVERREERGRDRRDERRRERGRDDKDRTRERRDTRKEERNGRRTNGHETSNRKEKSEIKPSDVSITTGAQTHNGIIVEMNAVKETESATNNVLRVGCSESYEDEGVSDEMMEVSDDDMPEDASMEDEDEMEETFEGVNEEVSMEGSERALTPDVFSPSGPSRRIDLQRSKFDVARKNVLLCLTGDDRVRIANLLPHLYDRTPFKGEVDASFFDSWPTGERPIGTSSIRTFPTKPPPGEDASGSTGSLPHSHSTSSLTSTFNSNNDQWKFKSKTKLVRNTTVASRPKNAVTTESSSSAEEVSGAPPTKKPRITSPEKNITVPTATKTTSLTATATKPPEKTTVPSTATKSLEKTTVPSTATKSLEKTTVPSTSLAKLPEKIVKAEPEVASLAPSVVVQPKVGTDEKDVIYDKEIQYSFVNPQTGERDGIKSIGEMESLLSEGVLQETTMCRVERYMWGININKLRKINGANFPFRWKPSKLGVLKKLLENRRKSMKNENGHSQESALADVNEMKKEEEEMDQASPVPSSVSIGESVVDELRNQTPSPTLKAMKEKVNEQPVPPKIVVSEEIQLIQTNVPVASPMKKSASAVFPSTSTLTTRPPPVSLPPRSALSLRKINGVNITPQSGVCYEYAETKQCKAGIFCKYTHPGEDRRVCSRMLRGRCRGGPDSRSSSPVCCSSTPKSTGDCPLPHPLLSHQMPICEFFLRTECKLSPAQCRLVHIKHNAKVPYCTFFNHGHCAKGDDCDYQHRYRPEVVNTFAVFEEPRVSRPLGRRLGRRLSTTEEGEKNGVEDKDDTSTLAWIM